MKRLCFLLSLPALLLLSSAWASAQSETNRFVVASGAVYAANAAFHIAGSLGQPIIGESSTLHRSSLQGFWYNSSSSISSAPVTGTSSATINCSPNPIAHSATVNFKVPIAGHITISLLDILGRNVMNIADGTRNAGTFSIDLNTQDLPEGQYTIRYQFDDGEKFLPVIIVK